jgi:(R,R)-butanediol dehydrogenase / meso-butanediol dehydrogenase / diacetyl reductase
MRALRWHAARDVRLDEVPEPRAARDEVVIEVAACGLCGSDLHEYLHGPVYIPKRPHPLTGLVPPVTLGHEFSGRVVEVGEAAERLRVGDRVAVNPCLLCGECVWCRRGQPNYCAKLGSLGLSRDGALARFVSVPEYGCHPLPDGVSDEEGATVEPLAVTAHAWRRARLSGGEPVAVVGAGPIGLLLVQVLRAKGAGFIAVIEPREERRTLARALGADLVVDPVGGDAARAIAEATDGERAEAAFECVGSGAAFDLATRVTGKGGRVVLVGLIPEAVSMNALSLLAHEKEIIGSSAYVGEFADAIALLARGQVRVEPLITGRVPLARARPDGLDALLRREERHVKILITSGADGRGA